VIVRDFPGLPPDLFSFWTRLHPRPRHGFILGSGAGTEHDHLVYMSATEPARVLTVTADGRGWDDVRTTLADEKRRLFFPRLVGVVGFEAGRTFDPGLARLDLPRSAFPWPPALFGDYRNVVRLDLKRKVTTVIAESEPDAWRVAALLSGVRNERPRRAPIPARVRFRKPAFGAFEKKVRAVKEAIRRGDIYQANLSLPFELPYLGSPMDLYRRLCAMNPSPYAALIKAGARWVVSCSPELLLRVEKGQVASRPIAGTRPRGADHAGDRALESQLTLSPKENAEHIMLVDLVRNDIGRVAKSGTVRVVERGAVERYSHVMHIVSEVRGALAADRNAVDALAALFPGGTITGCPKIKSIDIIQRQEGETRGPFYGSAGFFSWDGGALFNILIRTALLEGKRAILRVGAGIVADSRASREYREILAKAHALLQALGAVKWEKK
jgi:anthranilate/para-aminobenzoate synthase component I